MIKNALAVSLCVACLSVNAYAVPKFWSAQLQLMDSLLASKGKNVQLGADVARALDLTTGNETLTIRQFNIDAGNGESRSFARVPSSPNWLFSQTKPAGTDHVYLVDFDFDLIAAVVVVKGVPSSLPIATAKAEKKEFIEILGRELDAMKKH
jgi:hypothetical protein